VTRGFRSPLTQVWSEQCAAFQSKNIRTEISEEFRRSSRIQNEIRIQSWYGLAIDYEKKVKQQRRRIDVANGHVLLSDSWFSTRQRSNSPGIYSCLTFC